MNTNSEYQLLEAIHNNSPRVRQRDLAEIAGLSLGMTNAILKRLAEKGWITVRRINSRNIRYVVTPEGMDELFRRSYGYFKRTIKHVVRYRTTLEQFTLQLRKQGFDTIILVGDSDLDFIVEHAAERAGLTLLQHLTGPEESADTTFVLFGESFRPGRIESPPAEKSAYLSGLLAGKGEVV